MIEIIPIRNIILYFFIITIKITLARDTKSKNNHHYFCGVNYLKTNIFETTPPPKEQNINLNLSSKEFFPVRIFLDLTFLNLQKNDISDSVMLNNFEVMLLALNQSVKAISEILKVERYEKNYFKDALNSTILFEKVDIWDEALNDSNYIHANYDYVLFAKLSDFEDSNINMLTEPFSLANDTHRPIIGIIKINKLLLIENKDNLEEFLKNIFFHELFHAFGFLRSAFKYFPGGENASIFTEIGTGGIERTYVKTEKVLNFAKKYFGCDNIKGVELENQGKDGSKNNHWESRILLGELMTSEVYEDEMVLSEFTLALMEDSGWYKVNYYTGGLMRFGKNRGCEFLNSYCLNGNKTEFPNEYYDIDLNNLNHPTCSTGRLSRSYNFLKDYDLSTIDDYKNLLPYIKDLYKGGYVPAADYCPVSYSFKPDEESKNGYFIGNCKYGNDNYGDKIRYINITTKQESYGNYNGKLSKDFGEKYDNNSFCMMNNLVPNYISNNSFDNLNIFGSVFHPMCFPSFCSSRSLTIQIYDQFVVCPRQGGNIIVEGYTGYLYCPDYNLICTGTKMCNEIFDCIEKKSLLREESLSYDYIPNTTSRYSEINNIKILNASEEGVNGICPGNCSQCSINKKCKKCKEGFKLIGQKEKDGNPIICDKNSINIEIGYYLNNEDGVYYKCHNNCLKCDKGPKNDDNMNCLECKEGFIFDDVNKNCNDDNTIIWIILGVIVGVIIISLIVVCIYEKFKKKNDDNLKNLMDDKEQIPMINVDETENE